MQGREDLDSFLEKWRLRWPEWRVAEAFVPAAARDVAIAWMCLRQELADAAWGGVDPRPGEAKLGWWAEELLGWSKGARRHPLARVLQPRDAPWATLAGSLPGLHEARERAADFDEARAILRPHAVAVAAVSLALDGAAAAAIDVPATAIASGLLGQRLLDAEPAATPLQARAALGPAATEAQLRAEAATQLLGDWRPATGLPRPDRIHLALLEGRLRALAKRGEPPGPLPAWRTLALAWRAARP